MNDESDLDCPPAKKLNIEKTQIPASSLQTPVSSHSNTHNPITHNQLAQCNR